MKSIISKTVTMVALAVTLLSFTTHGGSEGFEISLNGKMLLQQFGRTMDVLKTLQLDTAAPTDRLTIRYYHCGNRIGKNRVVTIKNGQNKTVKEWHFKDSPAEISCSVQDLRNLKKANDPVLNLYYASSELPQGRQLAAVSLDSRQHTTALLLLAGLRCW